MANDPVEPDDVHKVEDIDQFLVRQVQRGYQDAYNLLVIRYQYKVFNVVSRYIKDPSEAKDVSQEAFLRAYRALGRFRGESQFYTWLYRIVVNTAKNHVMKQHKQLTDHYDMDEMEYRMEHSEYIDIDTPERLMQKDEVESEVFQLIDELPKDLKVALTLREIDGLTYDEIAQVMLCPVGTVRSRIHRAREAIETQIGALHHKGKDHE